MNTKRRNIWDSIFVISCFSASGLMLLVALWFRFANPQLTETQLFLKLWDVMLMMIIYFCLGWIGHEINKGLK